MKAKIGIIILLYFLLFTGSVVKAQHTKDSEKWWKESVFYQIYMPSYADSNGDGYSDFKVMICILR